MKLIKRPDFGGLWVGIADLRVFSDLTHIPYKLPGGYEVLEHFYEKHVFA